MYGPAKLSSPAIKETILTAIKEKLDHMSNFENDSMGFYGVDLAFKIDLTFFARQEEELSVEGFKSIGEQPPDAKVTHEVVEGRHSAGKTKKKAS